MHAERAQLEVKSLHTSTGHNKKKLVHSKNEVSV